MSEKDNIAKALAKMEAESERIEAQKNRERQRAKRDTPVVTEISHQEVIEKQNQLDHLELKEKLKLRLIIGSVLAVGTLIYVISLNSSERALFVEDAVIWSAAGGMVLVAMLKR